MGLLELLGMGGEARQERRTEGDTRTVRKIVRRLEALEPDQARYLASFAYILGRVAMADREVTGDEDAEMERIVAEVGGLGEDVAVLVIQIAKSQAMLFGGTEDYLVTREFGRVATLDQKRKLMRCLFAVAAADGIVAVVEENEIARVASELKLPRGEMISAKEPYAAKLETILNKPGS
jgi:uncharacterized tellurite resistance protein B-like protein